MRTCSVSQGTLARERYFAVFEVSRALHDSLLHEI